MSDPAARVWTDPDTPATCLVALLVDRFSTPGAPPGESPVHWLPTTVADEIRHVFGVEIHPRNLDRLAAACLVLTRPHEFYESEKGFGDVARALASVWFDGGLAEAADLEEMLWAVVETYLIDPPDGDSDKNSPNDRADARRFGPAVVRYLNATARDEGFRRMPPAFASYGVPPDPAAWEDAHTDAYSDDPSLAPAVDAASDGREHDLALDLHDRLNALVDHVARLPIAAAPAVAGSLAAAVARHP